MVIVMKTTALGSFVIQAALGKLKVMEVPIEVAREASQQLTVRIRSRIDQVRKSHRRAFEKTKSWTVF